VFAVIHPRAVALYKTRPDGTPRNVWHGRVDSVDLYGGRADPWMTLVGYFNALRELGGMRRLVDDLLWLARFDSAGPAPSSEATDLGVLAQQAAERFTAVAEAHGLTMRVSVEPVSTMISAPPEWLDRLLGVLLDNACRYTPPGGTVDVLVGRRDGRVL